MDFLKLAKKAIIKNLFAQGAVHVDITKKFLLKGGVVSPVYCNVGVLECSMSMRSTISGALTIWTGQNCPDVDVVVGVVSGGISWASCIANNKALPLIRVHAYPKDHGLCKQIEGEMSLKGKKVLVVDDIITSGKSALEVVRVLRNNGADIVGIISIFDWDFPKINRKFKDENVRKHHLFTFKELLDYGFEQQLLPTEAKEEIKQFAKDIAAAAE